MTLCNNLHGAVLISVTMQDFFFFLTCRVIVVTIVLQEYIVMLK